MKIFAGPHEFCVSNGERRGPRRDTLAEAQTDREYYQIAPETLGRGGSDYLRWFNQQTPERRQHSIRILRVSRLIGRCRAGTRQQRLPAELGRFYG